jgi:hypothetical protein
MAIYKIFPEKTSTLYSYYPTLNSGLDEILELSTFYTVNQTNDLSRILIKFPQDQINDVITNNVSGSTFDSYLKLSLANASELPLDYTIYSYPLSGSWNVGTGKLADSPITTDGASWKYKDNISGSTWIGASFPSGTTGSYSGSNSGGGQWFTGSYEATQSFNNISSKDIEFKVTNTVNAWFSSSLSNDGFIVKHSPSIEFTSASKFELKYFSGVTHTIYPPCLEIRWNDTTYITGSLQLATSSLMVASIFNNKNEFQQDSIQRFRVNVRDRFPARSFQTTSVYLNNKVLSATSYWSIKDLDTEEIVIDYDTSYTKISSDATGNYFNVYMNGLEPERYYKLLIKTILPNKEVIVLDQDYYFKVIR